MGKNFNGRPSKSFSHGSNVHNGGPVGGYKAPTSSGGGKSSRGFSGYAPGMAKPASGSPKSGKK